MRDIAGQGVAYLHFPRRSTTAPHANVAATVDRAAPMALKSGGEEIGHPALDRAAQVELETRGATDHAEGIVDLHAAPSGGWIRASRATSRTRSTSAPAASRRQASTRDCGLVRDATSLTT